MICCSGCTTVMVELKHWKLRRSDSLYPPGLQENIKLATVATLGPIEYPDSWHEAPLIAHVCPKCYKVEFSVDKDVAEKLIEIENEKRRYD